MTRLTAIAAAAALLTTAPAAFALTPTDPAAPPAAEAAEADSATYTDAQIEAFAAATNEIEDIRARAEAAGGLNETFNAEIRAVLTRHDLTPEAYNTIAASVQTDQALAQRVAALRANSTHNTTTDQ